MFALVVLCTILSATPEIVPTGFTTRDVMMELSKITNTSVPTPIAAVVASN